MPVVIRIFPATYRMFITLASKLSLTCHGASRLAATPCSTPMLARYIQVLAVDVHLNFIWRVETLIGFRHIKPFLLFVKKVTLAN